MPAIGLVVTAKTIARFRQLEDRQFAEYYLLGTLASIATAILTGMVGVAALDLTPRSQSTVMSVGDGVRVT